MSAPPQSLPALQYKHAGSDKPAKCCFRFESSYRCSCAYKLKAVLSNICWNSSLISLKQKASINSDISEIRICVCKPPVPYWTHALMLPGSVVVYCCPQNILSSRLMLLVTHSCLPTWLQKLEMLDIIYNGCWLQIRQHHPDISTGLEVYSSRLGADKIFFKPPVALLSVESSTWYPGSLVCFWSMLSITGKQLLHE